ncbi:hypothetical protein AC579_9637 [Pseudocercospora musae]|uniref:Uncharacterized protein n=1 Tax=Pseudocercospora musae TaxID=113226 RepID=A0A139ITB0_9PEZI|nr:hypothetical protein AC579_9637 [Pseudocercospora musae]
MTRRRVGARSRVAALMRYARREQHSDSWRSRRRRNRGRPIDSGFVTATLEFSRPLHPVSRGRPEMRIVPSERVDRGVLSQLRIGWCWGSRTCPRHPPPLVQTGGRVTEVHRHSSGVTHVTMVLPSRPAVESAQEQITNERARLERDIWLLRMMLRMDLVGHRIAHRPSVLTLRGDVPRVVR